MDTRRSLGTLQLLTVRLRKVLAERATLLRSLRHTRQSADAFDEEKAKRSENGPGIILRRGSSRASAATSSSLQSIKDQLQRVDSVRERLLFRHIPITLSLVERTMRGRHVQRIHSCDDAHAAGDLLSCEGVNNAHALLSRTGTKEAAATTGQSPTREQSISTLLYATPSSVRSVHARQLLPSSTAPPTMALPQTRQLLMMMYYLETERAKLYAEKLAQERARFCRIASAWRRGTKAAHAANRTHGEESYSPNNDATGIADAGGSAKGGCATDTRMRWSDVRRGLRQDEELLRSSLIGRPFLSTRMWAIFLQQPVWTAAMSALAHGAQHAASTGREDNGAGNFAASLGASSHHVMKHSQVLAMCRALSSMTLAVLHHYIAGGAVNAHNPRFAVSLPSRAWRASIASRAQPPPSSSASSPSPCLASIRRKTKDAAPLEKREEERHITSGGMANELHALMESQQREQDAIASHQLREECRPSSEDEVGNATTRHSRSSADHHAERTPVSTHAEDQDKDNSHGAPELQADALFDILHSAEHEKNNERYSVRPPTAPFSSLLPASPAPEAMRMTCQAGSPFDNDTLHGSEGLHECHTASLSPHARQSRVPNNNNSVRRRSKRTERGMQAWLRRSNKHTAALRWIPSHGDNVLPCVIHTLALHAVVIPTLLSSSYSTARRCEVLRLLVTVQNMAKLTLLLCSNDTTTNTTEQHHRDNDNMSRNNSSSDCHDGVVAAVPLSKFKRGNSHVDADTLHNVLRCLEQVVVQASRTVYDGLVSEARDGVVVHPALTAEQTTRSVRNFTAAPAAAAAALSTSRAARLALDLDSLHLLRGARRDTATVLDHLIVAIFPQLRNNTHHMLQCKLQQSSLLTFATRRHRLALAQQLGNDGNGGAGGSAVFSHPRAEAYLRGTVIQQARLQQRQMAAALRERYLSKVQHGVLVQLACSMPLYDLVVLLQILATHASHLSASHMCRDVATKRICAVMYVSEAVLMAALLMRRKQAETAATHDSDMPAYLCASSFLNTSRSGTSADEVDDVVRYADGVAEVDEAECTDETDDDSNHNNSSSNNKAVSTLPLDSLARVWASLSALWIVIDHRREMQHAQKSSSAGKRGRMQHASSELHLPSGNTETHVMGKLTEYVLSDINGILAHRLQHLEDCKLRRTTRVAYLTQSPSMSAFAHGDQHEDSHYYGRGKAQSTGGRACIRTRRMASAATPSAIHIGSLAVLARGLTEWGSSVYASPLHDGGMMGCGGAGFGHHRRVACRRGTAVVRQAEQSAKLLKQIMMHDTDLWEMIEGNSLDERSRFERCILECLHAMGCADTTTCQAVQRVCSKVA